MRFTDCYGMSFPADGSNIVFSVRRKEYPKASYFELRIVACEGVEKGSGRVLMRDDKDNILPVFSCDGQNVLYIAQTRRNRTFMEVIDFTMGTVLYKSELCLLNVVTGDKKVLDVSNYPIEEHKFLSEAGRISYRKGKKLFRLTPKSKS